jgi:tetratricopeptide (TPR) repeat protein
VVLLAGFAAWTLLSIAWADVKGDAWDGANRTLLYLAVFALFALWRWRPGAAMVAFGAYAAAVAAVGAVTVARAAAADDLDRFFVSSRLAEPVGYPNANCALFLAAFWPALFLASRRSLPRGLRGPALATAGLLLHLALLPQSRGSLVAAPLVLAAYVALVPGRIRSLLALAPIAAVTALASPVLLDVYSPGASPAELRAVVDDAGIALLLSFAALLAIGAGWELLDRRVRLSERTVRLGSRLIALAAGAVVVALAVAALVAIGNPATWVLDRWDELTSVGTPEFRTSRLTLDLGSNRYDFWRVAVGEFRDSPLQGVGADNFAQDYVRERKSDEEPLYPHSLELAVLSQTGLVGTLLFAGFLGTALASALRARRAADPSAWPVAAAAVVTFGYWAIHGSVDWFWEFPGLGAPAVAWLGLAAALGRDAAPQPAPTAAPRPLRRLAVAAGALVLLAVAASLVPPWLAAREVDLAATSWRDDPGQAFERLDRARKLNVLSERPDLIAGAIASRLGDRARMKRAFLDALGRNPNDWYAQLEVAIVDSLEGRREAALARLARARELNPLEPAIALVSRQIRAGKPVSPRVIDRMFLQRVEARTS